MNLTNPTALFWAALAGPIVVFYILKIRMRRVPVSTVMFWEQVFEDKQPRSIWQTLRHLLSLLLQLSLLALLVFALAEPYFDWELREQRRVVLVLDNSASMQAADAAPTRLAAAKAKAARLIHGLKPRDEMAIITAGSQPRVACGLTSHQKTLQDAIDAAPPTDGPTHVSEAARLARRLLADHPKGQIIVLTDGCFDGANKLAKSEDVVWSAFGSPDTGNVGISRFQVRRSLLDPIGYEILIEVTNASDDAVDCRLDLVLGEEVIDVIPLKLEPNETWREVFRKTSAAGGRLEASIDYEDALPTDNLARAILPESQRFAVTLVTKGNLFLERVLQANALVDLTVRPDVPQKLAANEILILHGENPGVIPKGDVFVIQPKSDSDLWTVGETILDPIVTEQDEDSDLLLHVRLDNVLMPEALELIPQGKAHPLVESATGHPIYLQFDRPTGKVLVLSVNLSRGDLPLRTAFPIMMSNALAWFADRQGELREAIPTGTVAEVTLPETLRNRATKTALTLAAPDGSGRRILGGESVLVGPLDQAGVWRIQPSPSAVQSDTPNDADGSVAALELACNLTNAQESDLRSPADLQPRQEVMTAGFGGRPVWFLLIVVAWLLMATEWSLYQRRWIS